MAVDDSNVKISLDGMRQQFQQQIDFFRQKLNLPTERWDDIKTAAHDRAFMVAGAQKADLLNDLRKAVDKSVNGQSIGEFRKDFAAATAKSGWSGWTGEGTKAGEAWRTRVIYQTNVATSYAAGRWQQLNDPDLKAARPFWKYIHADGVIHPRPLHKAWGDAGLTLPSDHPFWRTHFPPNGWGCGCRVKAVRLPRGNDATSPPEGWDTIDEKTGAPLGIDKGWGYAPGRTWFPDLEKYPYEIARQVVADNIRDGVFKRWHDFLSSKVAAELALSEYSGLSANKKIDQLRKRVTAGEAFPAAVLPPNVVITMGVKTQIVNISDYDLIKQQVSRERQAFSAIDYLQAQVTLESPRLMVRENNQMTVFVSDESGRWYAAVLQQTASAKGVFLKSFRRSSEKDALLQRKKGEVLIDSLPQR